MSKYNARSDKDQGSEAERSILLLNPLFCDGSDLNPEFIRKWFLKSPDWAQKYRIKQTTPIPGSSLFVLKISYFRPNNTDDDQVSTSPHENLQKTRKSSLKKTQFLSKKYTSWISFFFMPASLRTTPSGLQNVRQFPEKKSRQFCFFLRQFSSEIFRVFRLLTEPKRVLISYGIHQRWLVKHWYSWDNFQNSNLTRQFQNLNFVRQPWDSVRVFRKRLLFNSSKRARVRVSAKSIDCYFFFVEIRKIVLRQFMKPSFLQTIGSKLSFAQKR